jgi:hypothetical protein
LVAEKKKELEAKLRKRMVKLKEHQDLSENMIELRLLEHDLESKNLRRDEPFWKELKELLASEDRLRYVPEHLDKILEAQTEAALKSELRKIMWKL